MECGVLGEHHETPYPNQRRSQNEAEEAMPPPKKKTCEDFSLVFYINLNFSKTNGRNSRTHVVSCSLTDQGLT